jgi:spore maturation protein CgeB
MRRRRPRILVVDQSAEMSLGASYFRGFKERGHDAHLFVTGRWTGWENDPRWVRAARRVARPASELLLNLDLVRAVRTLVPDVVLVMKGPALSPVTLEALRAPGRSLVVYLPDDLRNPLNTTARMRGCLPLWDVVFTPRPFAREELLQDGARRVESLPFAYDPFLSRPPEEPLSEGDPLRRQITFVGATAPERVELLSGLVRRGLPVAVFGPRWGESSLDPALAACCTSRAVVGDELRRVFHGSGANLSLLRRANRDLHQMRTFEVPACGGLLLAERTEDHAAWFENGREALLFDGLDECAALCERLLGDPAWARSVAAAGHRRLLADGHAYADRAQRLLELLER